MRFTTFWGAEMELTSLTCKRRLAARMVVAGVGVLSWQVLGVAGAWAQDAPATTTTSTTSTTSTTIALSSSESNAYHPWPAMALLLCSLLVILMALLFAYFYHRRLLNSLDKVTSVGTPMTIESSDARPGVLAEVEGLKVEGPNQATVGVEVTYLATGYDSTKTLGWTAEGGSPDPSSGSNPEFKVTFGAAGTAKVAATVEGATKVIDVTVSAAEAKSTSPIALPFVIRNWGGLVVAVLGVGVVAALMTMGVVSAEGGIGLLGALLGVGASTASSTPAVTQPTPAPPPAAGGDSQT